MLVTHVKDDKLLLLIRGKRRQRAFTCDVRVRAGVRSDLGFTVEPNLA